LRGNSLAHDKLGPFGQAFEREEDSMTFNCAICQDGVQDDDEGARFEAAAL
jgi:hypothetical protein